MNARTFFFYLFCLDVLFLPFPGFVNVPFSALALPFWVMAEFRHLRKSRLLLMCVFGVALSIASLAFKLIVGTPYVQEAMQNTGILCMMFASVALAHNYMTHYRVDVIPLLKCYLGFVAALSSVYLFDAALYFNIRSFWTLSGNLIEFERLSSLVRFTGTLSDPNNVAVISCSVLAYACFRQPRKLIENAILFALTAMIVASSMSITGLICFVAVAATYFMCARFSHNGFFNILIGASAALIFSILLAYALFMLRDNAVLSLMVERVREGSLDSRIARWVIATDIEKIFSSLLIGDGGVIIWHDRPISPHNGHFHVFFNYGLPVYLIFMAVFFGIRGLNNWRECVFLLIIFLGFTVNVGIYEPRFSGIWSLLSGSYLAAYNRARTSARVTHRARRLSTRRHSTRRLSKQPGQEHA